MTATDFSGWLAELGRWAAGFGPWAATTAGGVRTEAALDPVGVLGSVAVCTVAALIVAVCAVAVARTRGRRGAWVRWAALSAGLFAGGTLLITACTLVGALALAPTGSGDPAWPETAMAAGVPALSRGSVRGHEDVATGQTVWVDWTAEDAEAYAADLRAAGFNRDQREERPGLPGLYEFSAANAAGVRVQVGSVWGRGAINIGRDS